VPPHRAVDCRRPHRAIEHGPAPCRSMPRIDYESAAAAERVSPRGLIKTSWGIPWAGGPRKRGGLGPCSVPLSCAGAASNATEVCAGQQRSLQAT
jgi:hypothetical protein